MPWNAREEIINILRKLADDVEDGRYAPVVSSGSGSDGSYVVDAARSQDRITLHLRLEYTATSPEGGEAREP